MAKKNIHGRGGLWTAIIASFSLAILDMFFMKGVFEPNFGDIGGALIAFALATTANISALFWGKEAGQGRRGRSFMWSWIIMGFVYILIRAYGTYLEIEKNGTGLNNIMLQITYAIVLTFSYIGSGSLIKWASTKLWDKDITNYLSSKKEFEEQNEELANNKAAIWGMVKTFENYDENFKLLDSQYNKCKENIRKVEYSVMSQIVMKTIDEYPINPLDAEKVMENVLAKRDQENEKLHDKQV